MTRSGYAPRDARVAPMLLRLALVLAVTMGCGGGKKDTPAPDRWRHDAEGLRWECQSFASSAAASATTWIRNPSPKPADGDRDGVHACVFCRPTLAEISWVQLITGACRDATPSEHTASGNRVGGEIAYLMSEHGERWAPAKLYTLATCATERPAFGNDPGSCTDLRQMVAERLGHDPPVGGCWSDIDCLLFDDPPPCCSKYGVTALDLGLRAVGAHAPMVNPAPEKSP
jgi:hypothetical protein